MFDAGGLPVIMDMLIDNSKVLHKDTMRSCMNVVTRLIPRMEPKDPSMDSCVSSLSLLLTSEDPQVAEPAMKSFVALADRFIRRGKDPAPIVGKGLIEELMKRLSQIGKPLLPSAQGGGATAEKPSSHSVNTIVNLLSTLCRGSPAITHVSLSPSILIHMFIFLPLPLAQSLLRSNLLDALESALKGDER